MASHPEGPEYVHEALRRLEAGSVGGGSHLEGIFGRCAKVCEALARGHLAACLDESGLDYPALAKAEGLSPDFTRLTLGHVLGVARRFLREHPWPPAVTDPLDRVNSLWVQVKHRQPMHTQELKAGIWLAARAVDAIEIDRRQRTAPS